MQWTDVGIIIGHTRLGEHGHIVDVLTQDHGRCNGLCRKKPLPIGMGAHLLWRARLEDQLGYWTMEDSPTVDVMALYASPTGLKALSMMVCLVTQLLPARQEACAIYTKFAETLSVLQTPQWLSAYASFEVTLLEELGYGRLGSLFVDSVLGGLYALQPIFMQHWPTLTKMHNQRQTFLSWLNKKTPHHRAPVTDTPSQERQKHPRMLG